MNRHVSSEKTYLYTEFGVQGVIQMNRKDRSPFTSYLPNSTVDRNEIISIGCPLNATLLKNKDAVKMGRPTHANA